MNGDKAAVISAMMAGMVLVSALLLVGFLRYWRIAGTLRFVRTGGALWLFLGGPRSGGGRDEAQLFG